MAGGSIAVPESASMHGHVKLESLALSQARGYRLSGLTSCFCSSAVVLSERRLAGRLRYGLWALVVGAKRGLRRAACGCGVGDRRRGKRRPAGGNNGTGFQQVRQPGYIY